MEKFLLNAGMIVFLLAAVYCFILGTLVAMGRVRAGDYLGAFLFVFGLITPVGWLVFIALGVWALVERWSTRR